MKLRISLRTIALGVLLTFVFLFNTGATVFHFDIGRLMQQALRANEEHRLVLLGLPGNFGAQYGPIACWIYQGLLMATSNIFLIYFIKSTASFLLIAASLYSLSKDFEYPIEAAIVGIFGYSIFWLSRDLWDNSLLLPFGAAFIAFLAKWIFTERKRYLAGAFFFSWLLLHTHLMSTMLVLPCLAHAAFSTWPRWRGSRDTWFLIVGFVIACTPYGLYVCQNFHPPEGKSSMALASKVKFVLSIPEYYVTPTFITEGVRDYFHSFGSIIYYVFYIFYIPYILFYTGLAFLVKDSISASSTPAVKILSRTLLLAYGVHVGFYLTTSALLYIHYINGLWIISAIFIARSASVIIKSQIGKSFIAAYSFAAAIAFFFIPLYIEGRGGVMNGPSLTNQQQAVSSVLEFTSKAENVKQDVLFWREYPVIFETLLEIEKKHQGNRRPKSEELCVISYKESDQHLNLWYKVTAAPR